MTVNLKELLNSEAAEIAKKIDANDGAYDGDVNVKLFNKFLEENGYKTYSSLNETIPYIEAVKYIYNIKKERQHLEPIKVDFDQEEELRKDRKRINRY